DPPSPRRAAGARRSTSRIVRDGGRCPHFHCRIPIGERPMVRQTMTTKRLPAHPRSPARADRPDGAATDNGQRTTDKRRGFTLVELLIVVVVLAVLVALLLPAINGALRTARNAAVSAEINQLAQALEQFKSKYG